MSENEALLTAAQVAERLNIPIQSVWRLARRGELACVRYGARALRFHPHDVDRWIDNNTTTRPRGSRA